MSVSPEQKRTIDSIVSVFETGRLPNPAAYATCTVLRDGAGVSYGKHQCTDKSGSLDLVVKRYIELGGQYAEKLKKYLPYLATNETSKVDPSKAYPMWMAELIATLKSAGADLVMHRAQDEVFDTNYWAPAMRACQEMGLTSALAHAVIYDTCIHSGPGMVANMRKRFAAVPPSLGGDEKEFIKQYCAAREAWLASSSNELVRRTVYRMDAFQILISADNWSLTLPFPVRGVIVA